MNSEHLKTSFEPISNDDCSILILGSMPGDKSIELNQYYGHSRNRFWLILSTILKEDLPITYEEKLRFLNKNKISVWDVAHTATRKGSLDSAMKNEIPNDLYSFIEKHKNLKTIGFNGLKAENLFNKHFKQQANLRYVVLPSFSPSNTIKFEDICNSWKKILE